MLDGYGNILPQTSHLMQAPGSRAVWHMYALTVPHTIPHWPENGGHVNKGLQDGEILFDSFADCGTECT
jgi:hypothetical protein